MRVANKKSAHPKNIPPLQDIVEKFAKKEDELKRNDSLSDDSALEENGYQDKVKEEGEVCNDHPASNDVFATTAAVSNNGNNSVDELTKTWREEEDEEELSDRLDRKLLEQNIKLQERVSALMLELRGGDEEEATKKMNTTSELLSKLMRSNSNTLPSVIPPKQSRSREHDQLHAELKHRPKNGEVDSLKTSSTTSLSPLKHERPWCCQHASTEIQLKKRILSLEESISIRKEEAKKCNQSIIKLKSKVDKLQIDVNKIKEDILTQTRGTKNFILNNGKIKHFSNEIEMLEENLRSKKSILSHFSLEIRRESCLLDNFKSRVLVLEKEASSKNRARSKSRSKSPNGGKMKKKKKGRKKGHLKNMSNKKEKVENREDDASEDILQGETSSLNDTEVPFDVTTQDIAQPISE